MAEAVLSKYLLEGLVILLDLHLFPCVLRAVIGTDIQRIAIKCARLDGLKSAAEVDDAKRGTIGKGLHADLLHAVRDPDAAQGAAESEHDGNDQLQGRSPVHRELRQRIPTLYGRAAYCTI